ncbi:FIGNL1-interacting regulator of recombination and mitosis [Anoplolepis gracilipes]|uniref:FIGNL1-interacting regulator of recombination and mitosis n=1 Tax=Anoplolepis gracilipes TaxID=354296 RepID=UPI003BA1628E
MSSPSNTISFSEASSYQLEKDFFDIDDSQVNKLQELLENKDFVLDTECLLQILKQCLSRYIVESLDEQLFKKVLPKAQHFLSQIVRSIDDKITSDNVRLDDLDDIKHKLRICDGMLAFWKNCIEHVSTLGEVRAPYVTSLCDTLPETIKIIFEHCKTSPKYGVLLSGVMQELRNLFTKGGTIFKLFFATLNGVIVFDTDVQLETELLTKVIDAYGNIASIVNGMDTKTFVDLSEAFAKLALVYHDSIKPNNVVIHLAQMAKDISCLLFTIKDQKDKNTERSLMVAMRLLKILEKLTAVYNKCLSYETMLHLVKLSAHIYGYLCFNLTKGDEGTISIDATSLLDIIFNHDDFKQVYFQYGKQIVSHDQQVNYHLLTIAIMKKLNKMPYEHHCKWSLGSDSILNVALTYIEYLGEEICVGELRLSGTHEIGESSQLISVYEATLIFFCDLVSKIRPEDFHTLETLLLKYLLCGHFWSSLLSLDVWCFIGKLGTSQLCVDHIKHLIKVSVILIERRDSIEAIMLDHLIISLFELLTEDMKSALLKNLVENLDTNYEPILYLLIARTKGFSLKQLRHQYEDLPKAFLDLQEHPSIRNWKRLMQSISAMITVDYSDNKDIIESLNKIWTFVEDAIIECEGKQLNILTDLIVNLIDATCLGNLQDNTFCSILKSIAISCVYLPPHGKIKVCYFLRRCAEDLDHCGVQSVASILIGLFAHLLENENPWVRQEALKTFEYMGQKCSEQLIAKIAKALAKIPNISSVMQAYLSSRPYYSLEGFANKQDYFRYLAKAIQNRNKHICYEYNESEREEKMPRLEKEENSCDVIKPISIIQLDERAEELCTELTKVLEGRAVIRDTVCRKLITIVEKILRAK